MRSESNVIRDWTAALDDDAFRDELCRVIRALPLKQLQRFPPPRTEGLPLGHELRIARRFVAGGSSLLDESGLSKAYRLLSSTSQRQLYDALLLGRAADEAWWRKLVGGQAIDAWVQRDLLRPVDDGRLECEFRVISMGPLQFVVDHAPQFQWRVHIGQDSLNMVEFLRHRVSRSGGAMLDVGTGSGFQLINLVGDRARGVGVDINPRAVRASRLNVELNRCQSCAIEFQDALDASWRPQRFDLATWNTPFRFYRDDEVADNVDGHGGHLGIALTCQFIDRLVDLLSPTGEAHLLTAAPIMLDGENRLETELAKRARQLKFDIVAHPLQLYWDPARDQFHRSHGIRMFESVMVEIRAGTGRFARSNVGMAHRSRDWLRKCLHDSKLRDRLLSFRGVRRS